MDLIENIFLKSEAYFAYRLINYSSSSVALAWAASVAAACLAADVVPLQQETELYTKEIKGAFPANAAFPYQ